MKKKLCSDNSKENVLEVKITLEPSMQKTESNVLDAINEAMETIKKQQSNTKKK